MTATARHSSRNRIRESTSRRVFRVINTTVLILLALICLLPFINVLAISFSDSFFVDSNQVYFWPKGFTLSAYTYILTRASFWSSFRTSLLRVALGGALNLFFIILTAYPLSKSNDRLHFRNVYTWYFFITMLISGGMIPNYLLICNMGLRDTIWSLVLPGALPVFNLVLMLNFFRQVPPRPGGRRPDRRRGPSAHAGADLSAGFPARHRDHHPVLHRQSLERLV